MLTARPNVPGGYMCNIRTSKACVCGMIYHPVSEVATAGGLTACQLLLKSCLTAKLPLSNGDNDPTSNCSYDLESNAHVQLVATKLAEQI